MEEQIMINGVDVMAQESGAALELLQKELQKVEWYHGEKGSFWNMMKLTKAMITKVDPDDDDEMKYVFEAVRKVLTFLDTFGCGDVEKGSELEILDFMVEKGISLTESRYYSGDRTNFRDYLIKSVFDKYPLIQKLSQMGIDLNEALVDGITPVHILVNRDRKGSPYKVEEEEQELARIMDFFSVESMEALDKRGTSAVHTAVKENHFEVLEAMIRKGINVNLTEDRPAVAGTTLLHKACAYGFPKVVQILMDAGADDTMKDVNEETPAHVAVSEKVRFKKITAEERAEMIKALKNIDIPGRGGQTPLMLAQDYQLFISITLTPVLIEKGADVNRKDDDGNNAIMLYARWSCHMEVLKPMVKAGLDINARNNDGDTVLHLALKNNRSQEARYLLKKGADYTIANKEQVTPQQLAVKNGLEEVLELMV